MARGFREVETPTASVPANFTRLGTAAPTTSPTNNILRVGATSIPLMASIYASPPRTPFAVTSYQKIETDTGVTTTGGAIAPGDPFTAIGSTPGHYTVKFHSGATPSAANIMGGGAYSLANTRAGLPDNPPARPEATDTKQAEDPLHCLMAIAPPRISIENAAAPGGEILLAQDRVDYLTTNYLAYDAARPKPLLLNFPYFNNSSGQAAGISSAVSTLPAIERIEGPNEPPGDGSVVGFGGTPNAGFITRAQAFYAAVKAGRSDAQVFGPCPVRIGGADLPALRALMEAGYDNYVDGYSFHLYPLPTGDLQLGRMMWDGWISLLTEFGAHTKPRACTEPGSEFAAEYGLGQPMRQASRTMLDLMLSEQYGVQKEAWHLFSPYHDLDYPSWIYADSGQPYPVTLAILTHSQELYGTTWEARHDYGTVDNLCIIGSSYRRSDGTGVVSVKANGRESAPVTYQVTGGAPGTITKVDWRGRTSTATVTSGLVTVNAGEMPIYLRQPTGVTLTPVDGDLRYGLSRGASATVTSSTGSRGLSSLRHAASSLPKVWRNALYYNTDNNGSGISVWESKDVLTTPQTVTFTWASAVPVDKMYVHCHPAWQSLSTIKDAVVEVWDGDSWNATDAVIDQAFDVRHLPSNSQDGYNAFAEVEGFMHNVWELDFTRVTTTAVRLKVSALSAGGVPDEDTMEAFGTLSETGNPIAIGMGTYAPRVNLQHIEPFDSESEDVTPDGPDEPTVKYLVLAPATP